MLRNLEGKTFDLAKEVISQCSSDDLAVPLDLCCYLVDLKLLQLSGDGSLKLNNSDLTEELIKACVNDLKTDSLSNKILKLQWFWRKKYQSRDEIKKTHHERIFKNVLPILLEITESAPIKTADKDHIYRKIVLFVIMFAGLGSPSQQSIIKEAQAALNSIFKAIEIENFLCLPKSAKEQQLIEFARLITGILLFNKDCKKGGEGMDDLPLILTQGVRATKDRLLSLKDQLDQKIGRLAEPLLQWYERRGLEEVENRDDYSEKAISIPSEFRVEKFEEFKTLLVYFRQMEFCLNDLMKDLEKSFVAVEELVERLQGTLLQVHNVVRYRVAVATVQVFPLFFYLSSIWVQMQEEVDILSEINNNFVDLSLVAKSTIATSFELPFSHDTVASPDSEEIQQSSDFYPGVTVCAISSVSNQRLQYEGFCAWTLAHTEGLLITGNITLGVLQFSNRSYTFSSAEAAYKWASNPNIFINTVLKVARVKPELIELLNLRNDLLEKSTVEVEQKPTVVSTEVQTVLHPVDSFIDKNYTFSEWEMKMRALRLATLTKCLTKSQQTIKQSCFRMEMGVQVTPSRTVGTQTAKDAYCNHPTFPQSVLTLRRESEDTQHKREKSKN